MASLRLFRVAGIDIRLHPSWLVIFLLVTWSLATAYFPLVMPRETATSHWVLGAVASILLFASVLVHELAHSLVARRRGLEVRSITLFLFGGVSSLSGESPRPGVEFIVAIVGPLSSFVLAAASFAIALAVPPDSPVGSVFGYLAIVNLLLGGFNLIPGFPLDGGRVLRAIIWRATGSLTRATEIAGTIGIFVAYGFFTWGFLRVLQGDLLGGLWTAAIGWFLQSAASATIQQVRIDATLRGTRVGDIVQPDDRSVPPGLDVAQLIEGHLLPQNRRAMPVTTDGRVVGMVTLGDLRDVPPERRSTTRVAEVMGGRDGVDVVRPTDSLAQALETLGRGDHEQAPVVDGRRLVGVLTRRDVLRQFQLRAALHIDGEEARTAAGRPPTERPTPDEPRTVEASR